MNRIKSRNKNNRQTKTYNKFSHYFTTFYLGFYIPCKTCRMPCSHVFSRSRFRCHAHGNELIVTPKQTKIIARLKPISIRNATNVTKTIICSRLNLQYDKTISYYRNSRAQLTIGNVRYLEDSSISLNRKARLHYRRTHLALHLRQRTVNLLNLRIRRRIRHNILVSDYTTQMDSISLSQLTDEGISGKTYFGGLLDELKNIRLL